MNAHMEKLMKVVEDSMTAHVPMPICELGLVLLSEREVKAYPLVKFERIMKAHPQDPGGVMAHYQPCK